MCQKSLAEFAARRRQRSKIIFSCDMCVRENTSQSAAHIICAPMAHKLCAQQTAILLPKKTKGFSAVLRGTPVRASLFSSPPHPLRLLNGGRCPHRTKSPMDAPHLQYILPYSAVGCRRPRLDRKENFGYNRRYTRFGGIYAVRR